MTSTNEITLADVEAVCPYDETFPTPLPDPTHDPYILLSWLVRHRYSPNTSPATIDATEAHLRAQEEFHKQSIYKLPRTLLGWKAAFNMTSAIENYKSQIKLTPEQIKAENPLQEVAARYTKLVKRGKEWTGCCPIHHEKTPSFSISEVKQMWFCFGGCARGGDVIDLVMLVENVSFKDALKLLST